MKIISQTEHNLFQSLSITEILDDEHFSYDALSGDCILIDGLIITTDIDHIPIKYHNNPTLLITMGVEPGRLRENIKVIYYSLSDTLEIFKQKLIDQICWNVNIFSWFDEKQYIKDNPEVVSYYLPDAINMGFSDRQRIYHHFLLFYYRFLSDDQKLWLQPVDIEFNEEDYLSKNPEAENYYLPWAEENGYSKRQRLFHHYCLYYKNKHN
jgi:hypothetical protein